MAAVEEEILRTKSASGYAARPGLWPDPLLTPGAVDVPAGETRAFWVRLYVPGKTPKGLYEGTLSVISAGGKLAEAKLSLMVFGFLWDAPGLLLAIPLTAALKAVCDNVKGLRPFGKFLGD